MRERSSRELLGRLLGTGNSVAGTASSVGMRGTCHSGRGRWAVFSPAASVASCSSFSPVWA